MSQWTRDHQTESISVSGFLYQQNIPQGYLQTSTDKYESDPRWLYLAVYVALSVTAVLIGTAKYAWAYKASVRASQVLFDNVMSRVLRAPLRWLDTVPIGRILNRFTADFSVLDSRLVNDVAEFLFTLLELCGISIAGFLVSPVMIVFAGVSVGVAVMIGTRYLSGAREVKRLESIAKSPILELFDCVRAGLGTIRAYDEVERYVNRYDLFQSGPYSCKACLACHNTGPFINCLLTKRLECIKPSTAILPLSCTSGCSING